jgi:hypothetical protein
MPLVLRSNDCEQYQVISSAYVFGMMNGERWDGKATEEVGLI